MAVIKSIDDLLQIVRNGGGLDMQVDHRTTPELVQLVSNAKPKSTIILRNANTRPTPDLVHIAANAKGCVIFVE